MSQEPLTISALTTYISRKFSLDPHLKQVAVIGEVSNYRHRPGGHQYFSLKDDKTRLSAVMFKRDFDRIPFNLSEGDQVIAIGEVGVYQPYGNYQLTIRQLRPSGAGALYLALQKLKEKLSKEGLFEIKQAPLPLFPRKIAVLTSPTGAVIHDILTTIARRYPIVDVTVFPIAVQGEAAVPSIVQAFQELKSREEDYDAVILARGGGSIEDLWGFNDEAVAQAILSIDLPVVSSIGHEVDTTIADLIADHRAATPTAAAMAVTPVLLEDVRYDLAQFRQRLDLAMRGRLQEAQRHLDRYSQSIVLKYPQRLYEPYQQQVDRLTDRLANQRRQYFQEAHYQVNRLEQSLKSVGLDRQVRYDQDHLAQVQERLKASMTHYLDKLGQGLAQEMELLDANSPLANFRRGYALVETQGETLRSVHQVDPEDKIQVQVADGYLSATVTDKTQEDLLIEKRK